MSHVSVLSLFGRMYAALFAFRPQRWLSNRSERFLAFHFTALTRHICWITSSSLPFALIC